MAAPGNPSIPWRASTGALDEARSTGALDEERRAHRRSTRTIRDLAALR
jgi:hypothetical protein